MKEILERINKLSKQDSMNLVELGLKTAEECGEMAQAILSYNKTNGCEYKGLKAEDVVEEAIDTIINAFAVIERVKKEDINIEKIFNKKLDKWDSKIFKNINIDLPYKIHDYLNNNDCLGNFDVMYGDQIEIDNEIYNVCGGDKEDQYEHFIFYKDEKVLISQLYKDKVKILIRR